MKPSVTICLFRALVLALAACGMSLQALGDETPKSGMPKIRIANDGRAFATEDAKPYRPMGMSYYRPDTGWAPQLWKKFDADAIRKDFVRMKGLGVNCARVFLSFSSFAAEPDALTQDGIEKFDRLLAIAEETGIYIHPAGLDCWEGVPQWASGDRIADERILAGLETFWKKFAARYKGRNVIFAYDLRNEPEVGWDSEPMRTQWNAWLKARYGSAEATAKAWGCAVDAIHWGVQPPPADREAEGNRQLLDYQHFREEVADAWTRRQAEAIKSVDPQALVTVGLIQWSVPALLPSIKHYSGFRPQRQAKFLDFMEVHFYPLATGFYDYRDEESLGRNLAYLESVVADVAAAGKPVVLAEFGWYGGGKLTLDGGSHPPAAEKDQAMWCRRAVETTQGLACGWLNWGLYDCPAATDVSQLTGLLKANGDSKEWAIEFERLSRLPQNDLKAPRKLGSRPAMDWDRLITSLRAGGEYREKYYQAFRGK